MRIPSFFKRTTEKLYDCTASVYTTKELEDDDNVFDDGDSTEFVEYIKDMPCRISTKSLGPISSNEGLDPNVDYELRLFCDFEKYKVLPGSRLIVIDRNGNEKQYKCSGEPFTNYSTHQAISIRREVFI